MANRAGDKGKFHLRAWRRTIVSCDGGYDHDNLTEYSLGVGIC